MATKRKGGRPPGRHYPVRVNVSLQADLAEALERLAAAEDRTVGYVARMLIMRGLEAAFAVDSGPDRGVLWPDLGKVQGLIDLIREGGLLPTRGPRRTADATDWLSPERSGRGRPRA